jgi:hypothetical protein
VRLVKQQHAADDQAAKGWERHRSEDEEFIDEPPRNSATLPFRLDPSARGPRKQKARVVVAVNHECSKDLIGKERCVGWRVAVLVSFPSRVSITQWGDADLMGRGFCLSSHRFVPNRSSADQRRRLKHQHEEPALNLC